MKQKNFNHRIKKLSLIGNILNEDYIPESHEEIEQRLTIYEDGLVEYRAYKYGNTDGKYYEEGKNKTFQISPSKLLDLFKEFEDKVSVEEVAEAYGSWSLEIEENGRVYKIASEYGVLGEDSRLKALSKLLRKTVEIYDLFAFDGNIETDEIERVTVEFIKTNYIKNKEFDTKKVKVTYKEKLIVDAKNESIEHSQEVYDLCKTYKKYEYNGSVRAMMEKFNANTFFGYTEGNSKEEKSNKKIRYKITIEYKNWEKRILEGNYNRQGLPTDYPYFINAYQWLMQLYGFGEIFSEKNYGRTVKKEGEYIYCSVIFKENGKPYYYRTDDEDIAVNDLVVVPRGNNNENVVAKVIGIDYFEAERVPYPLEKTKFIISKYVE